METFYNLIDNLILGLQLCFRNMILGFVMEDKGFWVCRLIGYKELQRQRGFELQNSGLAILFWLQQNEMLR
jgi:hypothetical protein